MANGARQSCGRPARWPATQGADRPGFGHVRAAAMSVCVYTAVPGHIPATDRPTAALPITCRRLMSGESRTAGQQSRDDPAG